LGHAPFIVKNTFLDPPAERSDSLEDFIEERKVASCPATRDHTLDSPRTVMPTPRGTAAQTASDQCLDSRNAAQLSNAVDLQSTSCQTPIEDAKVPADSLSALTEFQSQAGMHSSCKHQPSVDTGRAQLQSLGPSPQPSAWRSFSGNSSSMASGQEIALPAGAFSEGFSASPAFWVQASTPVLPAWLQNVGDGLAGALVGGSWGIHGTQDSLHMANDTMHPSMASQHGAASTWQPSHVGEAPCVGFQGSNVSYCRSAMQASPGTYTAQASGVVNLNLSSIFESELCANDGETAALRHHGVGECKPCMFFHKDGCRQGDECSFCHFCPPEERKKKMRWQKLHEKQRLMKQEARRLAAGLAEEDQGLAGDAGADPHAVDDEHAELTVTDEFAKVSRV